jgi:hypothetical protein
MPDCLFAACMTYRLQELGGALVSFIAQQALTQVTQVRIQLRFGA